MGAEAVLSTATVTRSRQEGDSFARTDRQGHLDLLGVVAGHGIERFVFVSFPELPLEFPLQDAKRAVEQRLQASSVAHTILRPGLFLETWLGPAAGWDLAAHQARVWGDGDAKQNWVSMRDVVQVAVGSLDDARAEDAVIEVAGDWTPALAHAAQASELRQFSVPTLIL